MALNNLIRQSKGSFLHIMLNHLPKNYAIISYFFYRLFR